MPLLLLEIGCEELPASAVDEAGAQLPALCLEHLGKRPSQLLLGPRRLAFLAEDVSADPPLEWRKGPPVGVAFDDEGRPTKAAEGFARRHGLEPEALERRDGFVGVAVAGQPLAERLRAIVDGLAFAKSMWWEPGRRRFSRPVRWLCGKLDGVTVEGFDAHSFGHRFSSTRVEISASTVYADTLRAARVEPDARVRERTIREGLDALGEWGDPRGVLREVVHLVEWPLVLEGTFDERYLELPRAVVETAMQSHQRYFPLPGARFAFVANGGDPEVVRRGNEQVLEGRLEDAEFTYVRDVAVGIEGLAQRLASITFFAGAGSYADKAERVSRLVRELDGNDHALVAARLAKADQASELVREFPDLEGQIGAHYARLAGLPDEVCTAIEQHYLPDSAAGPLPGTREGRILSTADKLDTLAVSFELGHRPSGSRDPYGLRRAAIGICRLAIEGDVSIARALMAPDVREFVEERLEGMLDLPVEFTRAARAADAATLGEVAQLARTLAALPHERISRLDTVFTRAARIVAQAGEELPPLEAQLLAEPAERAVADATSEAAHRVADAPDLDARIAALERLAPALERFFEDVLVMAEDEAVRRNRLRLLADVRDLIQRHAGDLSQIPL